MIGKLILEDGTQLAGVSFGSSILAAGEVVFSTGMVGYPESLTDPSFKGQLLVLTYPLIGNYGVPKKDFWESEKIQTSGIIVSTYNDTPSHSTSSQTLSAWLKKENIPGLEIKDTRLLTQKIREKGTMLGKIVFEKDIELTDPNKRNLIAEVSTEKIIIHTPIKKRKNLKTILLIDCGVKKNIINSLLKRGVRVIQVPHNFNPFVDFKEQFDGILISNGPGDPKSATTTIETIKESMRRKIPTFGVCMGNQLIALAGGGDTYKLKFGHRSQNQPCIEVGTKRCYITTQNHGYAIGAIPKGFEPWFVNANDNSIEGIKHRSHPFMSVQFHPEATPGPTDTEWIFDHFLKVLDTVKQ